MALLVVSAGSGPAAQVQDRRATGGAALAGLGGRFESRVVTVLDGDTFEVVTIDRRRVRIRLEGIDCPERGEPFSNVARSFTRQLAFDKAVQVEVRDVDRYGRLVARVTSEGEDLSQTLVAAGLATHYTVFRFDRRLEEAERRARAERRGMWAQGLPPPIAERGSSPSTPLHAPDPRLVDRARGLERVLVEESYASRALEPSIGQWNGFRCESKGGTTSNS